MQKSTYLIIDLLTILFPFLFSFHPRIKFYKTWHYFLPSTFLIAALFIVWDIIFTRWQVWGFNKDFVTGYYLDFLPIEEVMFFICIPYACMFTYFVLTRVFSIRWPTVDNRLVMPSFAIVLFCIGLINYSRWYTATTFIGLSIALACCHYLFKMVELGRFVTIYAILLLPFFLVNGLLTGSFIGRVVVYYNNAENLSIRLLTIPIEDIFYGMLLILLNVIAFEYFQSRLLLNK